MSDSTILSQDFKEFVELLNHHEVKYMITGGYAVAIYGHPRYTGDIDVWIEASKVNADKLVSVFNDFGLSSFGLKSEHFTKPDQVIQIGYPPYRIDILTSIDGVIFHEAYQNKKKVEIDGIDVRFIGLEDLIKNKKATGRGIDLDDIENLKD
ncbi:MAG: nucleotidyltransferase [Bacteroidota bacterium]